MLSKNLIKLVAFLLTFLILFLTYIYSYGSFRYYNNVVLDLASYLNSSRYFNENYTTELSLLNLESGALTYLLHGIIVTGKKFCKYHKKFGKQTQDGGYDVCLEGGLKPDPSSCKVMSFGINNDWSFDESLASYGCYVHSFDPSMGLLDHMHSANVQFHNEGLGKLNDDPSHNKQHWTMVTMKTAIQQANWSKEVIDVIKCDAEGAEWAFLEDTIENLFKVKQIILEIHSPKVNPQTVGKNDLMYMIRLFMKLQENGFVVDHSYHETWCCTVFAPMFPPEISEKCCHEVYLYNTRYFS